MNITNTVMLLAILGLTGCCKTSCSKKKATTTTVTTTQAVKNPLATTKDVTIYFAHAKAKIADLDAKNKSELDKVCEIVKAKQDDKQTFHIHVIGHASKVGSDAVNQKFSTRRAEAVAAYIKAQCPTVTVKTIGHGETEATGVAAQDRSAVVSFVAPVAKLAPNTVQSVEVETIDQEIIDEA